MTMWEAFDHMQVLHNEWSEKYGFTHTGSVPAVYGDRTWYGVKYPEPFLWMFSQEEDTFSIVTKDAWESYTDFPPPWPWADDGVSMQVPKQEAPSA